MSYSVRSTAGDGSEMQIAKFSIWIFQMRKFETKKFFFMPFTNGRSELIESPPFVRPSMGALVVETSTQLEVATVT